MNPWSSLITLVFHRKYSLVKAEVRMTHHFSFYHLHHHAKLPERVYLQTKTFPCWTQAQSKKKKEKSVLFCFFLVKCGTVKLAIFSYSFFPIAISKTCQNTVFHFKM